MMSVMLYALGASGSVNPYLAITIFIVVRSWKHYSACDTTYLSWTAQRLLDRSVQRLFTHLLVLGTRIYGEIA